MLIDQVGKYCCSFVRSARGVSVHILEVYFKAIFIATYWVYF
jgi:hypothetical protein